jgi:hypothetical protein
MLRVGEDGRVRNHLEFSSRGFEIQPVPAINSSNEVVTSQLTVVGVDHTVHCNIHY